MLDMIYYHVAQGHWNGVDWMASFCVLCNAGSLFNAHLNETLYHFAAQGYYDAMSLIADQETSSYWNHITGVCLHGPLAGARLERLAPLIQMTSAEAITTYPNSHLMLMTMTDAERSEADRYFATYRLPQEPKMGQGLLATLPAPDARLPRFDMGLGIWTRTTQRYYPVTTLYQKHNALIDEVDGCTVVVVLDVNVTLPIAFYWQTQQLEFHGDTLILGADTTYRKGVLYEKGRPMPVERPNQHAIRWYGFSSLFPNCEIYGQKK